MKEIKSRRSMLAFFVHAGDRDRRIVTGRT
jgi:hypothetical protein